MTRSEALRAAQDCLYVVRKSQGFDISQAQALRLQALAEAAKSYILLADSMKFD